MKSLLSRVHLKRQRAQMALIASLLVMLSFLLTGCRMAQGVTATQPAIKAAAAEPAAPSIQGKLMPRHSVSLSLAKGARVDQMFVKEGQPVSAGDVLVQLDGYEQSRARMIAAQAEELNCTPGHRCAASGRRNCSRQSGNRARPSCKRAGFRRRPSQFFSQTAAADDHRCRSGEFGAG